MVLMSGLLPEPAVSVSTMGLVINTSGEGPSRQAGHRALWPDQHAAAAHARQLPPCLHFEIHLA